MQINAFFNGANEITNFIVVLNGERVKGWQKEETTTVVIAKGKRTPYKIKFIVWKKKKNFKFDIKTVEIFEKKSFSLTVIFNAWKIKTNNMR